MALPPIKADDRLILQRVPNAGWIICIAASHPSMQSEPIAAYSSASDMLADLNAGLGPEKPAGAQ